LEDRLGLGLGRIARAVGCLGQDHDEQQTSSADRSTVAMAATVMQPARERRTSWNRPPAGSQVGSQSAPNEGSCRSWAMPMIARPVDSAPSATNQLSPNKPYGLRRGLHPDLQLRHNEPLPGQATNGDVRMRRLLAVLTASLALALTPVSAVHA
jgi:hypothetical protein